MGRNVDRTAWSVLTEQWHVAASPSHEHDGTTDNMRMRRQRHVSIHLSLGITRTYLKPLFNLLYEHIPVSSKAIHGEDSLVRSMRNRRVCC